jgi:hypothetical protein
MILRLLVSPWKIEKGSLKEINQVDLFKARIALTNLE